MFLAVDLWFGFNSGDPRQLVMYRPVGEEKEQLFFSAFEAEDTPRLWVYNASARPSPEPSTTSTPSASPTPSPSISASASPTPSITPSISSTPSNSPTPSVSPSASPSPSRLPVARNPGQGTHAQVGVLGTLVGSGESVSGDAGGRTVDLAQLRRGLPDVLVAAARMKGVRGWAGPPGQEGEWARRFSVVGARPDAEVVGRTSVLVEVLSSAPGNEPGNTTGEYSVITALETRMLLDERLVVFGREGGSGSGSGTGSVGNDSIGITVVGTLGAVEAAPCLCYEGAWVVPVAGESCPVRRLDTTTITLITIAIAALIPTIMLGMLSTHVSTFTGALTVGSVGL